MSVSEALRIVVYEEDGHWIAQCLEFDICTQADDRETLQDRMDCLIECEVAAMSESGQQLDPAPERFHNMWSKGSHSYKEVAA